MDTAKEVQRRARHLAWKKAYRLANLEKVKASVRIANRAHYQRNKEARLAYSKQWAKDNPERAKAAAKKWQAANREKVRKANRAWGERNKDKRKSDGRKWRGLPEPTRPETSVCECCGKIQESKSLSLDHCHVTGRFRGWLCNHCNLAIGRLGDDVAGLERAIRYLKRSEN